MSRPHKLMWTGVDLVTSLDPVSIWTAVDAAIGAGKGKRRLVSDEPTLRAYEITRSETLVASAPELTFVVRVSDAADGRRTVRTHIRTALLKDGSIPFGPKRMLGQKAYMAVCAALAQEIRRSDPAATPVVRDGAMPPGFDIAALSGPVPAPAP